MRGSHCNRLIPIAQRLDGSGLVWISCKQATVEQFQMDRFPRPQALYSGSPEVVGRRMRLPIKCTAARGTPYRIAYGRCITGHRHQSALVRLSSNHRRESIAVLCRLLDAVGAEWKHLCDSDNQPLDLVRYRAGIQSCLDVAGQLLDMPGSAL